MIDLARPEALPWLWLLLPAVLLFVWGERRRRRRLAVFAAGGAAAGAGATLPLRRTVLKGGLLLAALALLLASLAQPRLGFDWLDIKHNGADLVIVFDVSKSMLARDVEPSRLERARREVLDLLSELRGDRLGLVAFAGAAFVECPLTEDYGAVRQFIGFLAPDLIPVQGTDLGAAITTALGALFNGGEAEEAQSKAIILVTDGEDLEGHVDAAAKLLKEKGVKLYALGLGSKDGAPIPLPEGGFLKDRAGNVVVTHADEAALANLALATGGMYARGVAAGGDLAKLYRDGIAKAVDQGEKRVTHQRLWHERFQWLLALALLLLAAEHCLSDVRMDARNRRPVLAPKSARAGNGRASVNAIS